MARVELRALRKAWEDAVALDGVDLDVADGEMLAILGPSGCGKSTTLFLLAGIYEATSGDILFDGARVNDLEARARGVGVVFQSYALYPHLTVLENIRFPLRFQDVPDPEARAREMAALVQVEPLLARKPSQLSGGQQQRVALARALVKRPKLLLLDEPLSNLDAALRLEMRGQIGRIARELGVTTLLVTHDQLEATTMADRIALMNAGRIEQVGTAGDLYLRPATLFAAGFVGSPPMNLIEGRVTGGTFAAGDGTLPVHAPDGPATLGLRPEALSPGEGLLFAVEATEPMGRETLHTGATPLGRLRCLEATATPTLRPGDRTALAPDPARALLFDGRGRLIPEARLV